MSFITLILQSQYEKIYIARTYMGYINLIQQSIITRKLQFLCI